MRRQLQQHLTVGLAVLVLAAGWAGVWETAPWWQALGVTPQTWWHLGPLALMAGAIALRSRRPALALGLGLLIVLLDLGIGPNIGILLCLTDLIYGLGIRAAPRTVRVVEGLFAAVTVGAVILTAATGGDASAMLNAALIGVAVFMVPLWWSAEVRRGYPLWQDNDARAQLEAERHAALTREHELKRRTAVEEERRRMARELHDSVSSHVSAIALTSGAVLNAPAQADRDRRALETIRTTSVEALEQLRDMVQLLRSQQRQAEEEPGERAGQHHPGEQDYAELLADATWEDVVERARRQGLQLRVDGDPPRHLSPGLHHVLLRVLQESLTNALKHGDGTAHVQVSAGPASRKQRRIRLQVTSGLRPAAPLPATLRHDDGGPGRTASDDSDTATGTAPLTTGTAPLGTGTGLLAMQERVQLMEGRLRAGPVTLPDSGAPSSGTTAWRVEVELPDRKSTADQRKAAQ
ncbi:sensor histidine kinase [Nesterenkonia flava]|uniref:histidine kinase n=1 Tax=Nesterenkonia flava TaxID=469799 RepID=A0ABU1FTH7_9MICC|nr:histidine kinase [Nesterenkonia flava]MDR5711960.1 histidine kinase [Nesterenkonia flava]